MDDSKWERYGALGGIAFVVLVIVSIAVSGSTPKASDSAATILKSFHDHRDSLEVSAFIGALATIPILWWAASLWARMRRAEDRQPRLAVIAVLGLVFAGAAQTASGAVTAGVALALSNVNASQTKVFFLVSQSIGAAGSMGLAAMTLAVSALAFRTRVFPVWVAWLGLIDALAWVVASYAVASTSGAVGAFGLLAFALWGIWILAISIIMFRDRQTTPRLPVMPDAAVTTT